METAKEPQKAQVTMGLDFLEQQNVGYLDRILPHRTGQHSRWLNKDHRDRTGDEGFSVHPPEIRKVVGDLVSGDRPIEIEMAHRKYLKDKNMDQKKKREKERQTEAEKMARAKFFLEGKKPTPMSYSKG